MLGHDEADRLRKLVKPAPNSAMERSDRRRRRGRVLRLLGISLAAAIVIGSMIFAAMLLWSELSDEPEAEVVLGQTVPVTVTPQPESTTNPVDETATPAPEETIDGGSAFDRIRYLPAASIPDMTLVAIVRSSDAVPLAAFGQTGRTDELTGIVFIDIVQDEFIAGPGVISPSTVSIGSQRGQLTQAGQRLSNVIEWDHPTFGHLRAWGYGLTAREFEAVIEPLAATLTETEATLPARWASVDNYGGAGFRPIWRAHYLSDEGEPLVLATSPTSGSITPSVDESGCRSNESPICENVDVAINPENVEILLVGSVYRLEGLRSKIRLTAESNARIRQFEIEPLAELPTSAARQLLFLPEEDSGWQVTETLTHSSGRSITEPALVLIERDTPQIGNIVSTVVVRYLTDEPRSDAIDRYVIDGPAGEIEIAGWNHFEVELGLLEQLITVDDRGLNFAARAGASVGLERQYDQIISSPIPKSSLEGPVFGARLVNGAGSEAELRVSAVPSYFPEAAAIEPHDNERVLLTVRGKLASLIEFGGSAEITWEERPGTAIRLRGSNATAIIGLAESLELVRVDAVTVSEGSD